MKLYQINLNQHKLYVRASRASVALDRATQPFKESELIGACIIIVSSKEIKYHYFFLAGVPCDPPGCHKKAIVSEPFATLNEAEMAIDGFRAAHPEYNFVRIQKAEKQS